MPVRHKKPKTLYRYTCKSIEKHRLSASCIPQVVQENEYGVLWRCTCTGDYYGYASLKEAKAEEYDVTFERLRDEQEWLKKLTGKKNVKVSVDYLP